MAKNLIKLFLLFVSSFCFGAKPPNEILDQMVILSNIEATIGTCLNSIDYKKLNADEALKFHYVSNDVSNVIEKIEKRYSDDMAYLVVKMTAQEIIEKKDFKEFFAKTYSRKCAPQMLIDMKEALQITSKKIDNQIKRK